MSVKITLLVEGATEKAFLPAVRDFLKIRVPTGGMPKLDIMPYDGRIPTGKKLRKAVFLLLEAHVAPSDAVIALTDVYTGTREFAGAAQAKQLMRQWVGEEPRFHPHVALHDFEAWLLPFWHDIQRVSGKVRQTWQWVSGGLSPTSPFFLCFDHVEEYQHGQGRPLRHLCPATMALANRGIRFPDTLSDTGGKQPDDAGVAPGGCKSR